MQHITTLRIYIQRYLSWEAWQFFYIIFSISWLLAPGLDHIPGMQQLFISTYEDPGRPWALLFRICDMLAASLLGLAVIIVIRRRTVINRQFVIFVGLLAIIAVGSFIDSAFPSKCNPQFSFCVMPTHTSHIVHYYESIITSSAYFLLNILWVFQRKDGWSKAMLVGQSVWIAVLAFDQYTIQAGNSLVQFSYQTAVAIWIAAIVPRLLHRAPKRPSRQVSTIIIRLLAAWIFISGVIAITHAVSEVQEASRLSTFYFGGSTAWVSQHSTVVGIVLLFVSRHLWRGEYRAWQLTSILLWIEAIKYAVFTPNSWLAGIYAITGALLFAIRGSFDRLANTEQLQDRLKKLGIIVAVSITALVIGVLLFRLNRHEDIDSLHINIRHFFRHLFLIDVYNDLGPLPRRLIGQILNVAGLTLLIATLFALFQPKRPHFLAASKSSQQDVLNMLKQYSNFSEDYFKLWPQPKSYWWNETHTAFVTYRIEGNVAFALADPIVATDATRADAMQEFLLFCRQHGWRACFLMVNESQRHQYKKNGYKTFRIGASAVVDIPQFSNTTVRKKWWRWVMNRAKKASWEYRMLTPPHNMSTLRELRILSDKWLERAGHVERSFALGYFDEQYLQTCRLHILYEESRTIAFANELPIYNNLRTTTVDLMRFDPETDHAMPALLAHTINHLHTEGIYETFDLGFVPLASPNAGSQQLISRLGQLLMRGAVSAKGLEQFKNKLDPSWQHNYIAFDGDWADLLHITRWLDRLLKVSTHQ